MAPLLKKMSKMALINPSSDETFHFEVIDFKTISSLLQGCESVCEKEPSQKSEMYIMVALLDNVWKWHLSIFAYKLFK